MFLRKPLLLIAALVVPAALLLCADLRVGLSQEQGSKDTANVRKLLQERLAVLRQIANQLRHAHSIGNATVTSEQVYESENAVLRAELDLCELESERIAILSKILAVAKDHEKTVAALHKVGRATEASRLQARVARLEAEIALERAKAKPGPQSK